MVTKKKTDPPKKEVKTSDDAEMRRLAKDLERTNPDFIKYLRSKNLIPAK